MIKIKQLHRQQKKILFNFSDVSRVVVLLLLYENIKYKYN